MAYKYIYQNWNRGYYKLQSEDVTLWYYNNLYKSPNNENNNIESQKSAKKFLKRCESPKEWAQFAYKDGTLMFQIVKIEDEEVEAYIEYNRIHGKSITVNFLDHNKRVFMWYWFDKQKNGDYFITSMMFWEYIEGKTGEKDYKKSWQYNFDTDGNVAVIIRKPNSKTEEVWNSKEPLDLSSNWQRPPKKFGDWDSFFRLKRWKEGEISIISEKEQPKIFLSEKDDSVYKTFKGKDYTKEEWEAYEKEQWDKFNNKN